MRVRFTAKSLSWWKGVLQYAEDTNRTPSEQTRYRRDTQNAAKPHKPTWMQYATRLPSASLYGTRRYLPS